MGLQTIKAKKRLEKKWRVWEDIVLVLAGLVFLAMAAGLLYLAILYRPACYVAFGLWLLALVVLFAPLPRESILRPFAILCMVIAISIVIKCFLANIYAWAVGIMEDLTKIGDGSCFFW